MNTAYAINWLAALYGGIGLAIGLAFLWKGIERVDHGARGAYAFRPLLLPGLAILWPLVAARWLAAARSEH